MSSKQGPIRLRISSKRIIIIFTVMFLIFDAVFYLSFQYKNFWPLDPSFYIYTPALLLSSAFFCYISITKTYYEVDKGRLIHSKMGKEYEYKWCDVIYINEEWSLKHKMLLFYTKDGKPKYLAFDKHGVIFEYATKYAKLISYEEFKNRFSKVKL